MQANSDQCTQQENSDHNAALPKYVLRCAADAFSPPAFRRAAQIGAKTTPSGPASSNARMQQIIAAPLEGARRRADDPGIQPSAGLHRATHGVDMRAQENFFTSAFRE